MAGNIAATSNFVFGGEQQLVYIVDWWLWSNIAKSPN